MEYVRVLKKSLDFDVKLVDLYHFNTNMDTAHTKFNITKDDINAKDYSKSQYSAVRTINGQMWIKTKDDEFILGQGSFIILTTKSVQNLNSNIPSEFSVYNFTSEKAPPFFKLDTLYNIPFDQFEEQQKTLIFTRHKEDDLIANSIVHPLFSVQYYSWITSYENSKLSHSLYSFEINRAVEYINSNLDSKINISDLSKEVNLSERNFRKMFKVIMGVSPKSYQQELRLKNAVSQLKDNNLTISEISDNLGYYSQFHFSRDFKKRFGITPSEYKKKIIQ